MLRVLEIGLALGCDYPTAHLVISESIASKDRGKLVLSAFAFQAVGEGRLQAFPAILEPHPFRGAHPLGDHRRRIGRQRLQVAQVELAGPQPLGFAGDVA